MSRRRSFNLFLFSTILLTFVISFNRWFSFCIFLFVYYPTTATLLKRFLTFLMWFIWTFFWVLATFHRKCQNSRKLWARVILVILNLLIIYLCILIVRFWFDFLVNSIISFILLLILMIFLLILNLRKSPWFLFLLLYFIRTFVKTWLYRHWWQIILALLFTLYSLFSWWLSDLLYLCSRTICGKRGVHTSIIISSSDWWINYRLGFKR